MEYEPFWSCNGVEVRKYRSEPAPRFRMLAKCCGFKIEKYPNWWRTMTPDVYRHRPPTLEQKRFSL